MKNNKIILLTVILLSFLMGGASAGQYKNMIIFGDSLSDIGNNSWVYATGTPVTSFDKRGHKYTWVNYLAEKLFQKPAYSSYKDGKYSLTDNVSYAYASADTSANYLNADWPNKTPVPVINPDCTKPGLMKNDQGEVNGSCVPGLVKQVDLYLNDVKHAPNSSTLFFIWSGANDLFYKLPTGQPPEQIIKTAIANTIEARNKLLDAGVSPQQIYVMNLPDLSKTPYALKNSLNLTPVCTAFNTYLTAALTNPSDPNHPGIPSTHIISIFDLLNDIVQDPNKYHLKNATESCADNGESPLCKEYLFFDLKHPTANMHNIIAEFVNKIL